MNLDRVRISTKVKRIKKQYHRVKPSKTLSKNKMQHDLSEP